MTAFFLFWVLVAASLLSPAPVVGGIAIAVVLANGWINAAGAVLGVAIAATAGLAYWFDPSGGVGEIAYTTVAQVVAMGGWTVFVVALIFIARDLFPTKADPSVINRLFKEAPKF